MTLRRFITSALVLTLAATFTAQSAQPTSSYAGQEIRDIKALSPEDTAALLAGKGMGLAKAAELNGYPGKIFRLYSCSPQLRHHRSSCAGNARFQRK